MHLLHSWLQTTWSQWQTNLEQHRFASITLVIAQDGIGVEQLIDYASAALMCTTNASEACGFCHGCELYRSATHPDFHRIVPEKEGKSITVDQIRQCNKLAQESSQLAGYRLIVIEPADAMNESAANALLKTLESSNEKCFFLLVTADVHRMLPTITSRCQQVNIAAPSAKETTQWLQTQIQTSTAIQPYVSHLNNHAPLKALKFITENGIERYQRLETTFIECIQNNFSELSTCIKLINEAPIPHLTWLWILLTDTQKQQFGISSPDFTPASQHLANLKPYSLVYQQTQSLVLLLEQLKTFSGLNSELLIMNWILNFNEETCL